MQKTVEKKKKPVWPATAGLPYERLEVVEGWGGNCRSVSHVYRPSTVEGMAEVLEIARRNGRSVGLRGGGNSYGDLAMNSENVVLDTSRMNRVLAWNPLNGQIRFEPGLTLQALWEYILADGWWPPISTGTMKITMGGGLAVNAHGKNGWQMGTMGDHVLAFDLILPSGEVITCSREQNRDVFLGAIGGFGMLGCFTAVTMQMKRVYSGLLNVEAFTRPNLAETMQLVDAVKEDVDYVVGWLDAFSTGSALGRSEIHTACYLAPGEDPFPSQSLRRSNQHLPENVMGIIPRSIIWRFQRPFWNKFGMRFVNLGKFMAARLNDGHKYQQPHALFHFLLDYFDWKKPFGPGGLIQYQPFVPKETAEEVFTAILQTCQKWGQPNFLSVLKRHRPDDFLMSYAMDGFSMAMDFQITASNRATVVKLTQALDEIVLTGNGRFYPAKDSTIRPSVAQEYLGQERIQKFKALKQQCDPDHLLQSNFWRRVFEIGT